MLLSGLTSPAKVRFGSYVVEKPCDHVAHICSPQDQRSTAIDAVTEAATCRHAS